MHQVATPQHPEMPAQAWLADLQGVSQLQDRDLRDARQVLKNAQPRDARERLIVRPELAQRGIVQQRSRRHIKKPLWIIAGQ